jgi:maleylpyruvate isomerase
MARTLQDSLGWAEHGTKLVHEALTGLDEPDFAAASALPGWSRRHVTAPGAPAPTLPAWL